MGVGEFYIVDIIYLRFLKRSVSSSYNPLGYWFQSYFTVFFITDPRFGIACLGKVNMTYENDQDLMIQLYKFIANEEVVCDEAELGPDEFAERMHSQHIIQEQQLEMLKYMRKFHLDDQSAILEKVHQQMEDANFDNAASVLSSEQIQEIVRSRVSPLFMPR
ncbi:hypothetical protein Patl1_03040 [Pistacia atlantica]|uniref:Uncharacterized protein n=1 Tax=Pistacia atlantica TaxID=434234 RepID=A0ACC1C4T4_9ROSI|nr:hypothetical protein Patl1_03040 [Pistacia atlantica]